MHLLIALLILLAPFGLRAAAGPTNLPAPISVSLSADTNMVLTGPSTNLFTANSNLLNAAVAAQAGITTNGLASQGMVGVASNYLYTQITNATGGGATQGYVDNAIAGRQPTNANLTSWSAIAPSAKMDYSENLGDWSSTPLSILDGKLESGSTNDLAARLRMEIGATGTNATNYAQSLTNRLVGTNSLLSVFGITESALDPSKTVVVVDGDSKAVGLGTVLSNLLWFQRCAFITNCGAGGQGVQFTTNQWGTNATFLNSLLNGGTNGLYIHYSLHNDFNLNPYTEITTLSNFYNRLIASGWKIVHITTQPRGDYNGQALDAVFLPVVNNWARRQPPNSPIWRVVDAQVLAENCFGGQQFADTIHNTPAGYSNIAWSVVKEITSPYPTKWPERWAYYWGTNYIIVNPFTPNATSTLAMVIGRSGMKLVMGPNSVYYSVPAANSVYSGTYYDPSALPQSGVTMVGSAGAANRGNSVTAIGNAAAANNVGDYVTAIGVQADYNNGGANSSAVGYKAGYLGAGSSLAAFGDSAAAYNPGNNNTAIGSSSLGSLRGAIFSAYSSTSNRFGGTAILFGGPHNFTAGTLAITESTTYNGPTTLFATNIGADWIGITNAYVAGDYGVVHQGTPDNNTALGHWAGIYARKAVGNVYLGHAAGPSTSTDETNKLYIANNWGTPLIGGDFGAKTIDLNGKVTIGGSMNVSNSVMVASNLAVAGSVAVTNLAVQKADTNAPIAAFTGTASAAQLNGVTASGSFSGTFTGNGSFSTASFDSVDVTGWIIGARQTNVYTVNPGSSNLTANLDDLPTVTAGSNISVETNVVGTKKVFTVSGGSGLLPTNGSFGTVLMLSNNVPVWVQPEPLISDTMMASSSTISVGGATFSASGGASGTFDAAPATSLRGNRNFFWQGTIFQTNGIGGTGNTHSERLYYNQGLPKLNLNDGCYVLETEFAFVTALSNLSFQIGMLGTTASTNQTVGNFCEFNYAVGPNFVFKTIGTSSTNYDTGIAASLNTWYKIKLFGTTNQLVFYTNDIPCWTNSDNTTIGNSALILGALMTNCRTNPAGYTTRNDVFVDTFRCIRYR